MRLSETRLLYENAPTGNAATVVIASLLAYAHWDVVRRLRVLAWLSWVLLVAAGGVVLVRHTGALRRATPRAPDGTRASGGTGPSSARLRWRQPVVSLRLENHDLIESLQLARNDADALNRQLDLRVCNRTLRLMEADRRKDEFLATLAHELRNPLAPIRFALEMLKAGTLQPGRRQWAGGRNRAADRADPVAGAAVAEPQAAGLTRSLRVLIAEDNLDAAAMLELAVSNLGHITRIVHDGSSSIAAAAEFAPEVFFLDIGLPVMNGYEVARAPRAMPELHHVHIAAVTGWGQEEDRRKAREAGCDTHFTKPLSPKRWKTSSRPLRNARRTPRMHSPLPEPVWPIRAAPSEGAGGH